MATWFGRPTGTLEQQAADAVYQAQLEQYQNQLTAAQGIHGLGGQSMPSHTHTITTAHTNPFAQTTITTNPYATTTVPYAHPGGFTTVTSTGTGPIYSGTAPAWSMPQNAYYVELPKEPCEGDEITVYYQNGRWLEKNNFSDLNAIKPKHLSPNGGFSLHEIEEAERIMEELAA